MKPFEMGETRTVNSEGVDGVAVVNPIKLTRTKPAGLVEVLLGKHHPLTLLSDLGAARLALALWAASGRQPFCSCDFEKFISVDCPRHGDEA